MGISDCGRVTWLKVMIFGIDMFLRDRAVRYKSDASLIRPGSDAVLVGNQGIRDRYRF